MYLLCACQPYHIHIQERICSRAQTFSKIFLQISARSDWLDRVTLLAAVQAEEVNLCHLCHLQ